jgi:hypothetical protein
MATVTKENSKKDKEKQNKGLINRQNSRKESSRFKE